MKYVFIAVFSLWTATATVAQQLTVDEAMSIAESIWGSAATGSSTPAMLGLIRKSGELYWTRQIGYTDLAGKFRVVAEGNTWVTAFGNMPAGYLPPVKHVLVSETFNQFGVTIATSAPVEVLVCNKPCTPGVVDRVKEEK